MSFCLSWERRSCGLVAGGLVEVLRAPSSDALRMTGLLFFGVGRIGTPEARPYICAKRRAEPFEAQGKQASPLHRMLATAVWYYAEHGGH